MPPEPYPSLSGSIVPAILCGGAGTRLWPASRRSRPKQFLPLLADRSTFQGTMLRVADPSLFARALVVTHADHRFLVAEQLAAIGVEADILLEPEGRDSGPAFAVAAAHAAARDGADTPVLALAADHLIRDADGFRASVREALPAALAGRIVAFGIAPTAPVADYGYIEPGETLCEGVRAVRRFVEKPDRASAERFLADGYLWNSGNVLFAASAFLDEYRAADPDTVAAAEEAVAGARADLDFLRLPLEAYRRMRKLSVDYAVMERTRLAAVAAARFDWSDVGGWDAVRAALPKDGDGNAARGGEALFAEARRNLVSSDGPLVALVGVDDLVVVVTGDAVLVARREEQAGVKRLVEDLKRRRLSVTEEHLESFRPWGRYRSLDAGARHQVKRIVVKPGQRLSLQRHHHRSEHWVVVRGTARVTIDGTERTVHENESVHVPIGAVHRMENPGRIDLEIIEVQTGSYLGEDDIVRLEDLYSRTEDGAEAPPDRGTGP